MILVPIWHCGTVVATAKVDDADSPSILARKWFLHSAGYASGRRNKRHILMHREVVGLGARDGRVVDHLNGDKLDNRRANLEITTQSINAGRGKGWPVASPFPHDMVFRQVSQITSQEPQNVSGIQHNKNVG